MLGIQYFMYLHKKSNFIKSGDLGSQFIGLNSHFFRKINLVLLFKKISENVKKQIQYKHKISMKHNKIGRTAK